MKTLAILKVFFRLKHEELKEVGFYIWFPMLISNLIIALFFYKTDIWRDNCNEVPLIASYICAVLVVGAAELVIYLIICLMCMFVKLIRSNWQQAKREVEGEKIYYDTLTDKGWDTIKKKGL